MTLWPACILLDVDYTLADSSGAIVACIGSGDIGERRGAG